MQPPNIPSSQIFLPPIYEDYYSHTLRSDFHCETYIGISPYRTLAVVELQSIAVILFMT